MAITYTEEQRELVQLVRDVARNEVMPHVAAADKAGECPRELYQWGFDLGLHMVEIPEQFGGMGLSYETCAMMFEELAWVDAAYADTFVTNFVAFRNILLNGTEEQARHFVEKTENNGFAAKLQAEFTSDKIIIRNAYIDSVTGELFLETEEKEDSHG